MASKDLGNATEFLKSYVEELKAGQFKAMFEAAQTLTLVIDMACRANFKKSKGGAGLAGSFTEAPVLDRGGSLETGSYSPLPYAGIRETGGVIRRKSKRLTIPMTKKAVSTGSPLNWSGGKPLIYLFKRSSAGGGYAGVLATIKKARTKKNPAVFQTQYALRNYVTHPKSGYLSFSEKMAAPEVEKIIGDYAVKSFVDTKSPGVE
jgi:hypothetical protein